MAVIYNVIMNPFTAELQLILDASSVNGLTWKPGVANVASLPPTGNTINDARLVSDTHNLYI